MSKSERIDFGSNLKTQDGHLFLSKASVFSVETDPLKRGSKTPPFGPF